MKIAIIGSGGAGTCAAYLLDEGHDVTMFERKTYVGGNTHTVHVEVDGQVYHVDHGAAWFSPLIYPVFDWYQKMAGIEHDLLPLSLTFHDVQRNRSTCLPPVTARRIGQMLTQPHVLPQLLALNKLLNACDGIVRGHDGSISVGDFMRSLSISEEIKREFILPMLSGAWGTPDELIERFALYPVMK